MSLTEIAATVFKALIKITANWAVAKFICRPAESVHGCQVV